MSGSPREKGADEIIPVIFSAANKKNVFASRSQRLWVCSNPNFRTGTRRRQEGPGTRSGETKAVKGNWKRFLEFI